MERISWTDRMKNEEVLQSPGGKERSTYNKRTYNKRKEG